MIVLRIFEIGRSEFRVRDCGRRLRPCHSNTIDSLRTTSHSQARKGVTAIKRQLDDNDEAILALLREDGRMPFCDMAQRLDLTEATIRARIRRLENAKVMRVVARIDLRASGFPLTALVGLKIRGRSVDAVAQDLLKIPEIISILVVIGRADLEIQVCARSMEMLNDLINKHVAVIDGVVGLDTALAMDIVKYVQPWGSFE